MNNFKKLQEEQEEQYKDNLMGIKSSIDSNLGMIGGIMEMLDTYITKVIKCLLEISGGTSNESNKN